MSVETLFYIVGLTLTAAALAVSFAGLKAKGFPARGALFGVLAGFLVLVVATCGLAVAVARKEQDHRRHEQAEAAKLAEKSAEPTEASDDAAETGSGDAEAGSGDSDQAAGAAGPGGTLELKADASALAYDKTELESKPGEITINFDNPSPIPHDVVIRQPGGEDIAATDVITESSDSLVANLEPGDYEFFCSVPGHEQAGMTGTLKVS